MSGFADEIRQEVQEEMVIRIRANNKESEKTTVKELAKKYDYTEKSIRKIIT